MSAVMLPLAYVATPAEQAQSMMAKGDLQGSLKVFDDYLEAAPQDADTLRLARLGSHSELFG